MTRLNGITPTESNRSKRAVVASGTRGTPSAAVLGVRTFKVDQPDVKWDFHEKAVLVLEGRAKSEMQKIPANGAAQTAVVPADIDVTRKMVVISGIADPEEKRRVVGVEIILHPGVQPHQADPQADVPMGQKGEADVPTRQLGG